MTGRVTASRWRHGAIRLRWVLGRRVRPRPGADRGDVPGWVLVTMMTAGLVIALWAVAEPMLTRLFSESMESVVP